MKSVRIARTDLTVSRLAFGTASIHHLRSAARRRDLLSAAVDLGITHFDTARMYGEGTAERTLGECVAGARRSSVTIATKIGFPANPLEERMPPLMYAARAAGMVARRIGLPASRRRRTLRAADAEKSLADSLRALRTDWVDLLFVHEPLERELPQLLELAPWLRAAKASGRARWLGVSGHAADCVAVARAIPDLFDVLQVEDSVAGREADAVVQAGWPLQFTFGYLRLAKDMPPAATLAAALERNAAGAVVVSTRDTAHLRAWAGSSAGRPAA